MEGLDVKVAAGEMLATIPEDVKREMVAKSRWTCESKFGGNRVPQRSANFNTIKGKRRE